MCKSLNNWKTNYVYVVVAIDFRSAISEYNINQYIDKQLEIKQNRNQVCTTTHCV